MAICLGGGIIVSDMQGPCPDGFHVPLISELQNLCSIGETIGAWNSSTSGKNNFKSLLKMPWAGYRSGASVYSQGTYGGYRSSSGISREPEYSYYTIVDNNNYYDSAMIQRRTCMPIRPFKNTPARPDSSRTVLYQGTGTAGIYHNSTLGLISLSSDGTTRLTIADKNLGATTVYNSGDTLNQANCGGYFQRGNNYMFPFTGSVTTSSTQVNASTYGPGNYYNSSTFITSNPWDSSNNTNLRGGVSQGTTEKKVEPKKIYMWVEAPYTPLTYIQSTGTQYIDTGITQQYGTAIKATMNVTPTELTGFTFGNRYTQVGINASYGFTVNVNSTVIADFNGTNKEIITNNGTVAMTRDITDTSGNGLNLCLFTLGGAESRLLCKYKLYSCQIEVAGTLVRDLVPAQYNGEIGLWDNVNDTFYTNNGSGSFIYA